MTGDLEGSGKNVPCDRGAAFGQEQTSRQSDAGKLQILMSLRVDKHYRCGFLFVFVGLASAGGTAEVCVVFGLNSKILLSGQQ